MQCFMLRHMSVKVFLVVGFLLLTYKGFLSPRMIEESWYFIRSTAIDDPIIEHMDIVKNFIEKRKLNMKYSRLGEVLFLNGTRPLPRKRTYKILMHKVGEDEEERLLYYFGEERHEPFQYCDVKNCMVTYEDEDFKDADAIIFHLHSIHKEINPPVNVTRPPGQRWIFQSDESQLNTFMMQDSDWFNYSDVFNWSMMYRLESDVPVPNGRIIPLEIPILIPDTLSFKEKFKLLVPNAEIKRRDVLVAIMSCNCYANDRYDYVSDLQQFIKVDFYGECGSPELKEACPFESYGKECDHLKKYLFYLAFENSNCNGYLTEKFYTHSLKHGAVPVVMGMYKNQTEPLAPPNSFLHLDDFKTPEDLAKYILRLNETFEENYLQFHEWRKHFYSTGEDGYMGNRCYHYCRVCEALNYNDESPKFYGREDLANFLDPQRNCHENPEWN